jgi:hypothetical protein
LKVAVPEPFEPVIGMVRAEPVAALEVPAIVNIKAHTTSIITVVFVISVVSPFDAPTIKDEPLFVGYIRHGARKQPVE